MGDMIDAIIVDDEPRAVRTLELLIQKYCPEIHIIGVAHNIDDAYNLIVQKKPSLMFLDVNMPNGTGIELFERIRETENVKVVFTTAYQEYAIKALRLSALDYLLKPIDKKELLESVSRFKKKIDKSSKEKISVLTEVLQKKSYSRIAINSNDGVFVVNLDDIYYLSSEKNYSIFKLSDSSIIASKPLGDYEKILPDDQFVRVHRSFIININHIIKYDKKRKGVVLNDDQFIEVSRNKKDILIEKLKVV